MSATVTLTTTTLNAPCSASDPTVLPASLTGVTPGVCLYIDRELVTVVDPTLPGGAVRVLRGRDGTAATPHGSGATVTVGRGDQFYQGDPMGLPLPAVPVLPWINVSNGNIWVPQGDEDGPGINARYWRLITQSYNVIGLGIRSNPINPAFSGVAT